MDAPSWMGQQYFPYNGGNHGWLQINYRPGMDPLVFDLTWHQYANKIDRSYSLPGDRIPHSHIPIWGSKGYSLPGIEGNILQAIPKNMIDFSGKIQTITQERDYGDITDSRPDH